MTSNPYYEKVQQKLVRLKRKIEDQERKVFHTKYSKDPFVLYQELTQNKPQLQGLLRKGILNNDHFLLLFPSNRQTNSEEFDTTLLHVLLRNICGFKKPSTGWNGEPLSSNRSIIANFIRLKIGRNRIVHLGVAATNNNFYKRIYKYLKTPLLDLGCTSQELNDLIPKPLRFKFTSSVPNFAARNAEIKNVADTIDNILTCPGTLGVWISGLSGIGKSQISKKYFEEYSKKFDQNIVWINAEVLEESFKELAQFLNLTITDPHGQLKCINSIINEVHDFVCGDKVLFVFDNLDFDFKCTSASSLVTLDVLKYFPNHPGAVSMITSRNEVFHPQFVNIKLGHLNPTSAVDYVKTNLGALIATDSDLTAILEKLGYHTLAIEQFITYIQETRIPLKHYFQLLTEQPRSLLESGGDRMDACYFIRITIDKLKTMKNDLALRMLNMSRFLNGKEIQRGFFMQIFRSKISDKDKEDIEFTKELGEALRLLERLSLVSIALDTKCYKDDIITVHSLVQETVKYLQQDQKTEKTVFRTVLSGIFENNKHCKNDMTFVDFASYQYYYNQILYIHQSDNFPSDFLKVISKNAESIFNIFHHQDRLDIGEKIFKTIENYLQSNIIKTKNKKLLYRVQSYIGYTYYLKRNVFGASLIFLDVKKKQKRLLGKEHRDHLRSSLGYVRCLGLLRSLKESEKGLVLSMKLYKTHARVLGESHPHTLIVKRVIALNHSKLREHEPALRIYQEVLDAQVKIYGSYHPEVLTTRHDRALAQTSNRMKSLVEVLDDLLKMFDESNYFVLLTKFNIGKEKLGRGLYGEALLILSDVYHHWMLRYGGDHEDVKKVEDIIHYLNKIL